MAKSAASYEQNKKTAMHPKSETGSRNRLKDLLKTQSTGQIDDRDRLTLRGVCKNNLNHLDVSIPRGKLVVFTGVSGSGKSSLVFDTIYAEAQRRYIETLSPYARKNLDKIERAEADYIGGLSSAIAIEQKQLNKNPRSTVSTITEIGNYLRLLFSRIGLAHCLQCAYSIYPQTPLIEPRNCSHCGAAFPLMSSAAFTSNSPMGMCSQCNGLGKKLEVDPNKLIINSQTSILDGAISWFGNLRERDRSTWPVGPLDIIARFYDADLDAPWDELPADFRNVILYGSGDRKFRWSHVGSMREVLKPVKGLVPEIARLFFETKSHKTRDKYRSYMREMDCTGCAGSGLRPEALSVTLNGKHIMEVQQLTVDRLRDWLESLYDDLTPDLHIIAEESVLEVYRRLTHLIDVGLHYLSLSRPVPSLSGGEAQRVRMASQLSCGLVNMIYILDEPTIGLHPRDQGTLIAVIRRLRDMGNSVFVVEHDAEIIKAADWIVDIGPFAGRLGGDLIAEGPPECIMANPESLTGQYLSGNKNVSTPGPNQRRRSDNRYLSIIGADLNNLKHVTVRIPVGLITCVTGVSGSGKSSLISKTLEPALARILHRSARPSGPYEQIVGIEHVDKVVKISQDPIGRTPLSNPATYTKAFDLIRTVFANTEESKRRSFGPGRFSHNSKEGQCQNCSGYGYIKVEMYFLSDIWIPCNECQGKRYNDETLSITYRGKHIAQVLDMDFDEAIPFFDGNSKLTNILETAQRVGLGYLKLGQSASTLSGGEAQRIKMAKELSRPATGRTIYVLDEPTIGLHFADIQQLLVLMHELAEAGNTVIIIEHNLEVLKTADWIIDMGPDGGETGGRVIAEGPPERVAQIQTSQTGRYLRRVLN